MKQLILINNEKNLIKNIDDCILLGDWCKDNFEDENTQVLNYHCKDKLKLERNSNYLLQTYEKILLILLRELNNYHKENFSLRYWRIILGPWLFSFIFSVYDRYQTIKNIKFENSKYYVKKYLNTYKLTNTFSSEAYFKTFQNEWNYHIFLDLIKNFTDINIQEVNEKFNESKKEDIYKKKKTKILIERIVNLLNFKNNKIIIENCHISSIHKFLFYLKHKQKPFMLDFSFHKEFLIFIKNKDNFKREFKLNFDLKNTFENYLLKKIEENIPQIFTNHFTNLNKFLNYQNLPEKPKVIYTNNSYFLNDFFTFYSASKIYFKNTKYIIGQHGGGYNIGKYHYIKKHEIDTCDNYIEWGEAFNSKSISGSILKPQSFHKLKSKYQKQSKILFVTNGWSNFSTWSLHLNSYTLKEYIKKREIFFINLLPVVLQNIVIRFYKHNNYNEQISYWNNKYPYLKKDLGLNNIFDQYLSSKIIIVDFLYATSFIESIYLNIPTIIINDGNLFELDEKSVQIFGELKDSGIYFESYIEAAQHLNNIQNNVTKWWQSKKIILVRRKFLQIFCKNARDFNISNLINKFNK